MISPADYVIGRFGGIRKAARAIGIQPSTVQGWGKRGTIPQRHWDALIEAAKEIGTEITIPDFVTQHEAPEAAE